eukprot:5448855-Karenia_brevis.AAC.1
MDLENALGWIWKMYWYGPSKCVGMEPIAAPLKLAQLAFLVAMCALGPPSISEVTPATIYASKSMPQLGLEPSLSFAFRVYVVECNAPSGVSGPYYYVGIEHKSKVGDRLAQHFALKGSFFTRAHAPKALHLVWPAANTAVE